MDDSDQLYTDLFENLEDGQLVFRPSSHELEERIQQLTNAAKVTQAKLDDLQKQNEKLQKQNEVLIRNISCLFKTAQMEIARKDKLMKSLNEENIKLKLESSHARPPASWPRQSMRDMTSKERRTERGKSELAEGDPQQINSSFCSGNFRKRVRSGENWQALEEDNCAVKESGEGRKQGNGDAINQEKGDEVHHSRQPSTDAYRERRKERWVPGHSNHKERGYHDEGKVPRDSKKVIDSKSRESASDLDTSTRKEKRSEISDKGRVEYRQSLDGVM